MSDGPFYHALAHIDCLSKKRRNKASLWYSKAINRQLRYLQFDGPALLLYTRIYSVKCNFDFRLYM